MLNRPSKAAIYPVAVIAGVILATLLLLAFLNGRAYAQAADSIEYAENGTGAVATFTAVDPEGESIVWAVSGDGDMCGLRHRERGAEFPEFP